MRDHRSQREQARLRRRARRVLAPVIQVGGVDRADVERQPRLLETHWHQHAAISCTTRLAAHPARHHRSRRPHHHHRLRRHQLGVDLVVEFLAGTHLRSPRGRRK